MIDTIENLILDIDKLQAEFLDDYCKNHTSNINFKNKQVKHYFENKSLKHDFEVYLREYISLLDEFIISDSIADIEEKYKSFTFNNRRKELNTLFDKLYRYRKKDDIRGAVSFQKCINDILGFRLIIDKDLREDLEFKNRCLNLKEKKIIFRYYVRNDHDYHGIHIYFKRNSNFNLPWELQIWYNEHEEGNLRSHKKHKLQYTK